MFYRSIFANNTFHGILPSIEHGIASLIRIFLNCYFRLAVELNHDTCLSQNGPIWLLFLFFGIVALA